MGNRIRRCCSNEICQLSIHQGLVVESSETSPRQYRKDGTVGNVPGGATFGNNSAYALGLKHTF